VEKKRTGGEKDGYFIVWYFVFGFLCQYGVDGKRWSRYQVQFGGLFSSVWVLITHLVRIFGLRGLWVAMVW